MAKNQQPNSKNTAPAAAKPDKQAKFRQLANKRVTTALKRIEMVGNLGNRNAYAYTEDEANKVIGALKQAVAEAEARFRPSSKDPVTFDVTK